MHLYHSVIRMLLSYDFTGAEPAFVRPSPSYLLLFRERSMDALAKSESIRFQHFPMLKVREKRTIRAGPIVHIPRALPGAKAHLGRNAGHPWAHDTADACCRANAHF
jgi:hypothetical protein